MVWPGATIVCLGSGPSLTPEDVNAVRGKCPVIAVNSTYRLAPWADVLYACDRSWWTRERDGVAKYHGMKWSIDRTRSGLESSTKVEDKGPGISVLRNTGESGLESSPLGLRTGRNSGYQAMNLAWHLGARRIILLGYDMRLAADGAKHCGACTHVVEHTAKAVLAFAPAA